MRAEPDGPSACPLREPTIRIVLDRLVTVEFRPRSTLIDPLCGEVAAGSVVDRADEPMMRRGLDG